MKIYLGIPSALRCRQQPTPLFVEIKYLYMLPSKLWLLLARQRKRPWNQQLWYYPVFLKYSGLSTTNVPRLFHKCNVRYFYVSKHASWCIIVSVSFFVHMKTGAYLFSTPIWLLGEKSWFVTVIIVGPQLLTRVRIRCDIDCLEQDCRNSGARDIELLQSCTKPSIYLIVNTCVNFGAKTPYWK